MKDKTSTILGVLGIIIAFFSPIIGLILGVVGLIKRKTTTGLVLNIIAIVSAVLNWLVSIIFIIYRI